MKLGAPVVERPAVDDTVAALVWGLPAPMLSIASAPIGGGIGLREWVVNAQVAEHYARTDLAAHLGSIAHELGCHGDGVGLLTAADVARWSSADDGDVAAYATVGLRDPTWAADADAVPQATVGTINVVVGVPMRLDDAALVNAVTTATEAKTQALLEAGVPGTGTASDAVCVLCPADGASEPFGGPRSPAGMRIARAVHAAVAAGVVSWRSGAAA